MKNPDWPALRRLFPALKKYTFANAAGGAPLPRPVAEAGAAYYREAMEHGAAYWEKWLERLEASRRAVADLVNAAPREIAFTLNTSHGMSLIAGALKGRGTVLTMRDEFPSSTIPWINAGFRVRFVEPENGTYTAAGIRKNLTKDVKILLTSHVQYRTGFRQDLEAVGRLCREKKLIYVVNATQSFGAMPIDVRKAGMDFMAFSCFKWTMAGYGAAGLYIAGRNLKDMRLPQAGWRSVAVPEDMDNTAARMKPEASAAEAGCVHFAPVFALGEAARLLRRIGTENIRNRILSLNSRLEEGLSRLGAETSTPLSPGCRSGITIVKCRGAAKAVEKLASMGIMTAARGEGIRVSLHFYNDERDVDRLLAGLKKVL